MINSIYYYSSIQFPHYTHHTYPSITPTFILIASPFIYRHNTSLLPILRHSPPLPTYIHQSHQPFTQNTTPSTYHLSHNPPSTSFIIILPLPSSTFPTPLSSSSHSPS